ncbi:hypothetical protein F5884DRAFT_884180 [Xylogone sp. PMI_703]|nr:hypothetical protein F5884DRAFT_884180 [Xylogone sp. PMI_703]
MDAELISFKCSLQCALCRARLPLPSRRVGFQAPHNTAWEYKLVALCEVGTSNIDTKIYTILADLADAYSWRQFYVTLSNGRSVILDFHYEVPCRLTRRAHVIHLPCWKLINSLYPNTTSSFLYKYGQATYPMFDIDLICAVRDKFITAFTGIVTQCDIETELGQLLNRISQLPTEIQLSISEQCAPSLCFSLVTVAKKLSIFIRNSEKMDNSEQLVTELVSNTVHSLSAQIISMYGQSVISNLRFNDTGGILVPNTNIRGIKLAINHYGIQALRIVFTDETVTQWLGEPRNGWIGMIYGADIGRLRIFQDDLICVKVEFIEQEWQSPAQSVFWDKDLYFPRASFHQMVDTISPARVRNFPGWQMCHYLPLYNGGIYISGPTMYCEGYGVTGITAHSDSQPSRSIGKCYGVPIHFYFRPNERIVSMWVRTPLYYVDFPYSEPTILVTTSNNRTCLFGPSLPVNVVQTLQYGWTNVGSDLEFDVIGIFYDVLSKRPAKPDHFANIGITQDPSIGGHRKRQALPKVLLPSYFPPMRNVVLTGYCVFIAKFHDVKRIMARKVYARCTRISIHRNDGSIDVLGQWDPSGSTFISEIYNKVDGTLTGISFSFIEKDGFSHVNEITIGVDEMSPFRDFTPDQQRQSFLISNQDPVSTTSRDLSK